jgi:hypothetical protein
MSFFAVLDADDPEKRSEFGVERVHLNLWCLAGLWPGRRTFLFDVGLRIRALEVDVSEISVAVPFEVKKPEDLSRYVLNADIASLIFDEKIHSVVEKTLTYGPGEGEKLHVIAANVAKAEMSSNTSPGFGLCTLPLAVTIKAGDVGYVRIRFPVLDTGRTWTWTKTGLRRTGATLDFRISDHRSAAKTDASDTVPERIRPIDSVAAFVMAPAWLHGRTIHPEPRYIRLLENGAWVDYLGGRALELGRKARIVVYYWRNQVKTSPLPAMAKTADSIEAPPAVDDASAVVPPAVPPSDSVKANRVTLENPMRVYGDFKIDRARSAAVAILWTSPLVVAFTAWVFDVQVNAWVTDAGDWIAAVFVQIWTTLAALVSAAVVIRLLGLVPKVKTIARLQFLRFEEFVFRQRATFFAKK